MEVERGRMEPPSDTREGMPSPRCAYIRAFLWAEVEHYLPSAHGPGQLSN